MLHLQRGRLAPLSHLRRRPVLQPLLQVHLLLAVLLLAVLQVHLLLAMPQVQCCCVVQSVNPWNADTPQWIRSNVLVPSYFTLKP